MLNQNMDIWIITASSGDYEDFRTRCVGIVEGEAKARKLVEKYDDSAREIEKLWDRLYKKWEADESGETEYVSETHPRIFDKITRSADPTYRHEDRYFCERALTLPFPKAKLEATK